MKKMSPQTKSFAILAVIALIGSFIALVITTGPWMYQLEDSGINSGVKIIEYPVGGSANSNVSRKSTATSDIQPVGTNNWKQYNNAKYGIKFLYDPSWKVLPVTTKYGFTTLQIDPGKKYYNFVIYISPKEFAGVDGFNSTPETISGFVGMNIQNALYAVKTSNLYYTFDSGYSQTLKPQFKALVKSVALAQ